MFDAVERSAPQESSPGDERIEVMKTLKTKICLYKRRCCFSDLVNGLSSSPCPSGLTVKVWALESVVQVRTHKLMSTLLRQLHIHVYSCYDI